MNLPNPFNPNPNPAPPLDYPSQLSNSVNVIRYKNQNQGVPVQELNHFLNEVDAFIAEFRNVEAARAQRSRDARVEYQKTEHLMLGDVAYQAEKLLGQFALRNPQASLSASLREIANSRTKGFILIFAGINIGQLERSIRELKEARNKYAHPIICTKIEPTDTNLDICAKDLQRQFDWDVLVKFRNAILKEGPFWKEKQWKRLINGPVDQG